MFLEKINDLFDQNCLPTANVDIYQFKKQQEIGLISSFISLKLEINKRNDIRPCCLYSYPDH